MKTLRDEVRELRQKYWLSGLQSSADDLTDILSRHTEPEPEPTATSQRERIATACMAGMLADSLQSGRMAEYAKRAVTAADALIEELSKTAGHVRP